MSALLDTLTDAGVEVFVDAGQLRYRAPKGAMTSALRAALRQERTELLATLAAVPSALPAGAFCRCGCGIGCTCCPKWRRRRHRPE